MSVRRWRNLVNARGSATRGDPSVPRDDAGWWRRSTDSIRDARRRDRLDEIARGSQLLRVEPPRDRRDHDQIERRHDEDVLAAVAEREIGRVSGVRRGDPPLVAVAGPAARRVPGALPRRRGGRVLGVDDLLAVPLPVSQIELSQLEHVPRGQLES